MKKKTMFVCHNCKKKVKIVWKPALTMESFMCEKCTRKVYKIPQNESLGEYCFVGLSEINYEEMKKVLQKIFKEEE